jgi:thiol-disulfide isomerase/thioredoxin
MFGLGLLLATRILIGDSFPEMQLPSLASGEVALPAAGHVVVVELFATWCDSCRDALPIMERLREHFGDRVTFVTVGEDEGDDARAKVVRFAAALQLSGPVLLDADHALYDRLGVRKLPTAYVIDALGVVRHIDNGFGPGYEARLTRWIESTLEGRDRPPSPARR